MKTQKRSLFEVFNAGKRTLVVLYGARGVGKTTLLTQLAASYEQRSFLLFYRENESLVSNILEEQEFGRGNVTVKFIERFKSLSEYIKIIVDVISEAVTNEKPLVCTDILSPEILLKPFESEEEIFLFGKLIAYLFMISTIGTLILEIEENPRLMLPYRWFALVEIADKFIMMRRGHRLRVLYEVQLSLPGVGEKWNHEEVRKTIKFRRLLSLVPKRKFGFRVIG